MSKCKFCEAMEMNRSLDHYSKEIRPDAKFRYSVAIVRRNFFKGYRGCQGRTTDYRYMGCGYKLNFCPECGRKLTKNSAIDASPESQ